MFNLRFCVQRPLAFSHLVFCFSQSCQLTVRQLNPRQYTADIPLVKSKSIFLDNHILLNFTSFLCNCVISSAEFTS